VAAGKADAEAEASSIVTAVGKVADAVKQQMDAYAAAGLAWIQSVVPAALSDLDAQNAAAAADIDQVAHDAAQTIHGLGQDAVDEVDTLVPDAKTENHDIALAHKAYVIAMAQNTATNSNAAAAQNVSNIASQPDANFSNEQPGSFDGGGWWEWTYDVLTAFDNGLNQGVVNILNGFQDAVIGLVNLGLWASPTGQIASALGYSITIPSPDWSNGMFVQESESCHFWSKLIGGEGLMTLVTLGVGELRPIGAGSAAADQAGWLRWMKGPNLDPSLAGTTTLGYTTETGEVFLNPLLTRAEQAMVLRHESVHAFFTVRSGPFAAARNAAEVGAYRYSAFFQATEEIIAETFATGSLRTGIAHAFSGAYSTPFYTVSKLSFTLEAGGLGAGLYGFYQMLVPVAEDVGEALGG